MSRVHLDTQGPIARVTLDNPGKLNAFTPDSLRDLARRAGFIPVRRPSAFVTTRARDVLRAAMNWIYQPKTTDIFLKRADN